MRVLHVTEALGGGLISSLQAMVEATPEVDHHLIARYREGCDTGVDLEAGFASVTELPGNPVAAARRLHATLNDVFPDVVHAHSSLAGVLARVVRPGKARVVYTPHCFAFDRADISTVQRVVFERIERTLVPRTDLVAAVSPREAEAAMGLGHSAISYVPNRATLTTPARAEHASPLRIVTVGRVTPAKDWRYFIHLKRYAEHELGLDARWEWLGGGDSDGEEAITAAGIELSGWLTRDEILARTAAAQVYVHTAAWESAPLSVLEAAALGLPLVMRSIRSLRSLEMPGLCESVPEMAARIAELRDPASWAAAADESDALSHRHSRQVQGRQLLDAYERACDPGLGAAPLSVDDRLASVPTPGSELVVARPAAFAAAGGR